MPNHTALYATTTAMVLAFPHAFAGDYDDRPEFRDAWLDGKLETTYLFNRHLNNFDINTDVRNGVAYLSGRVESDIDRDLAVEIARNLDGIADVKSELEVGESTTAEMDPEVNDEKSSFAQRVDDATTTAAVKSRLIANTHVTAMNINVDTKNDVVTLSGEVGSAEERQLAEEIARSTGDVRTVENRLGVQDELEEAE